MNIYFVNTKNDISDIVYAENPDEAVEITKERCLDEHILSRYDANNAVFTTEAVNPVKNGGSSFITWIMKADRQNYLSGYDNVHKLDQTKQNKENGKEKELYFVVSDKNLAAMVYSDDKKNAVELVKNKAEENTLFDKSTLDNITYSAIKLEKFIIPILGSYHLGWAYKNGCNDYLKPAREHYRQNLAEEELLEEVVWE